MDETVCLKEFEKLAHRVGIEIRYTKGGPSGLCMVKGDNILFIDNTLDKRGQIDVFVREFSVLDMEGIFVVPVIRRLLGMEDEALY